MNSAAEFSAIASNPTANISPPFKLYSPNVKFCVSQGAKVEFCSFCIRISGTKIGLCVVPVSPEVALNIKPSGTFQAVIADGEVVSVSTLEPSFRLLSLNTAPSV